MIFENEICILLLSFISLTVSRDYSLFLLEGKNNGEDIFRNAEYTTRGINIHTETDNRDFYTNVWLKSNKIKVVNKDSLTLDSMLGRATTVTPKDQKTSDFYINISTNEEEKVISSNSSYENQKSINNNFWSEENTLEKPPSDFLKMIVKNYIDDLDTKKVIQNRKKQIKKEREYKNNYKERKFGLKKEESSNIVDYFIKVPIKARSRKLLNDFPLSELGNKGNKRMQENPKTIEISYTSLSTSWDENCNSEPYGICVQFSKCPENAILPISNNICVELDSSQSLVCCLDSEVLRPPDPQPADVNIDNYKNKLNGYEDYSILNITDSKGDRIIETNITLKDEENKYTEIAHRAVNTNTEKWKSSPTPPWTIPGTTGHGYPSNITTRIWDINDYWVAWKKQFEEDHKNPSTKKQFKPLQTTPNSNLDSWERWKKKQVNKKKEEGNKKKNKEWYKFFSSSWERFDEKRKKKKQKGWTARSWEIFLNRQWKKLRVLILELKKMHSSLEDSSFSSWERWKHKQKKRKEKNKPTNFEDGIDWSHWVKPLYVRTETKTDANVKYEDSKNKIKKEKVHRRKKKFHPKIVNTRKKFIPNHNLGSNILVEKKYKGPMVLFSSYTSKAVDSSLQKSRLRYKKQSMFTTLMNKQSEEIDDKYGNYDKEYGLLYY